MKISDLIYGDRVIVTMNDSTIYRLKVRNVGISLFWASGPDRLSCYRVQDIKKIEKDNTRARE